MQEKEKKEENKIFKDIDPIKIQKMAEEVDTSKFPVDKTTEKGIANDYQTELRIAEVVRMLLEGYQTFKIYEHGQDQWKIGTRMIDNYIRKAKECVIENVKLMEVNSIEHHTAFLLQLRQKAMESGNFKDALACHKELAKVHGLYKPVEKKLDITTTNVTININRPKIDAPIIDITPLLDETEEQDGDQL